MYFIEKLIKIYLKCSKKKNPPIVAAEFNDNYVLEDVVTCHHNFLPVDSTGNILACSKCGFVIKKDMLNKKN